MAWVSSLEPPSTTTRSSQKLAEAIKPWHGDLAFVLFGLVCLHLAAVAKHMVIDRDGLIRRMLPGRA